MRGFADCNPIAVTVYFLAVAGIAMFIADPLLYAISLVGAVLLFLLRNGCRDGKSHLFSLGLFAIMALINPLVSHRGATVLFVMNDNPVTLEALIYGICAAAMFLAVLYWFRSYSQIMTSDKLLYLFGALSPGLALTLSMGLRYVPLLRDHARRVQQTQTALGLYREDNLIDSIRGRLRVFSATATWALENGITTADSMTARGYGAGRRSRFSPFRFRRGDATLIAVILLLLALILWGLRGMSFTFYPTITLPPVTAAGGIGYAAYGLLALLPSLVEGKEALKWHFLRSNI